MTSTRPVHEMVPTRHEPMDPGAGEHYAMYSVFRAAPPLPVPQGERAGAVAALESSLAAIDGLATRGWYDVSGFRADADVMVWWWACRAETLQHAYHVVRTSQIGRGLAPVWSGVGVHRQAEFNAAHVPAFLTGAPPRDYLCLYPFDRSYEWYLLPEDERRALLSEHGQAARGFVDIQANTLSAFGLGDYEWLLAFEADDLVRIVDLIRHLRATGARRHVRNEIPFFTGPRLPASELFAAFG